PSAVDEPALHTPGRAHAGGRGGVWPARGRGHSARQSDGAAEGRERRSRDAQEALSGAAEDSRSAVLPLSVRSDPRLEPLPNERRARHRADTRAAGVHDGVCGADLRRRRAGGRRQDRAVAGRGGRARRGRSAAAELQGRDVPVSGSGRDTRCTGFGGGGRLSSALRERIAGGTRFVERIAGNASSVLPFADTREERPVARRRPSLAAERSTLDTFRYVGGASGSKSGG